MSQAAITSHPKCRELQASCYDSRGWRHAYACYRDLVDANLSSESVVLDLGCGRTFPSAERLLRKTAHVFGIDPNAEADSTPRTATFLRASGEAIPAEDEKFDLVICQCVLEHLQRPAEVFEEVRRVLIKGGRFIALTPSGFDYVSLAARLMPNRWHPWLVRRTEGRSEGDVFPTCYRANSRRQLRRLGEGAGMDLLELEYLHHCPSYFMFSPMLFRLAMFYDRVICRPTSLAFLRGWILATLVKNEE